MTRSVALAHLVRLEDGMSEGVWAGHTLRSAFQPICAVHGEQIEVTAYEGLLRAFRGGEPIAPIAFFTSIPDLDRLHVETLTRTLHLLNAAVALPERASIFINFNPSVFKDIAVAGSILREMRLVLHEAGIDAGRVVCEITEQQSASEEMLLGFSDALRGNGFRIAVDDYGAADSDIARVAALKPDIVKFDAQWMARLMESDPGFLLLKTMVGTFEERGIRTVFEGIEEPWQIELAIEAGASMLQGYAIALPELATPRRERQLGALKASHPILGQAGVTQMDRPAPISTRSFGRRTSHQ